MKLSWKDFITTHSTSQNLQDAAPAIINLFEDISTDNDRIAGLSSISESLPTVILTLNPVKKKITSTFAHSKTGFTSIRNQDPSHVLALEGFETSAIPVLLDAHQLMGTSTSSHNTPSIEEFMSMIDAEDPIDYLKSLAENRPADEADATPVRLAAILPPPVSHAISNLDPYADNWKILETIVRSVNTLCPSEGIEEDRVAHATLYLPVFRSVWAFCVHDDATDLSTQQCASSELSHITWAKNLHQIHLSQADDLNNSNNPDSAISTASEAIAHFVAKSMKGGPKFARSEDDDDDDKDDEDDASNMKQWKKMDKTLKKAYLFACSIDGETVPTKPTAKFLQILACKNGPMAIRLFMSWHPKLNLVILPGMATNIVKGIWTSTPDEHAINTFSPFFTPCASAGFSNMSNDELNSLALSSSSFNLSQDDIKKMTSCKPYIPSNHYLLKRQIKIFGAVTGDNFGEESLLSKSIEETWKHMEANESAYERIMAEYQHFAVYFLHKVHFTTQAILHRCFQAKAVQDVPFESFTMQHVLKQIETMTFVVTVPKWYIDMEAKATLKQNKSDTGGSTGTITRSNNRRSRGSYSDDNKRSRIENTNLDPVVALKTGETYSDLIHWNNLRKFENMAVKIDDQYICNNFHIRGHCHTNCKRAKTHINLTGENKGKFRRYCLQLRKGLSDFKNRRDTKDYSTTNENREASNRDPLGNYNSIFNSSSTKAEAIPTTTTNSITTATTKFHALPNSPSRPLSINKQCITSPTHHSTTDLKSVRILSKKEELLKSKSLTSKYNTQRKYPSNCISTTFPARDDCSTLDIPSTIRHILKETYPPLNKSPFIFDRTTKAATHNSLLLEQFNFDVDKATQSTPNTILSYGAEFRPPSTIEPLLRLHPNWNKVKDIITNGVKYPMNPIDDDQRKEDIDRLLERGNHKSALTKENAAALNKAFDKEVKFNWAIPILPHCIKLIKDACLTPLGVAVQWSINAKNERILKRRVTHDCSFVGPASNTSPNSRVISDLLEPCEYGHAFRRFIHGIHDIRRRHPSTKIWMNKTDLDAAYRRIHANASAAVTCITAIEEIAYLTIRLPFGASPAPTKFSLVSDMIGDLAIDIALCESWNPEELRSSFNLDFPPIQVHDSIPFAEADPLAVSLPPRDIVGDNFIDDLFQGCVDMADNTERIKHAVPLALECVFKPTNPLDACPRNKIINMSKHEAEGRLEERKVILGWLIDTHRFRVFLTKEKAKDWIRDIDEALQHGSCKKATLESMIGRFNHTGYVVHLSRYFLSRLRFRLHQYIHHRKSASVRLAHWDIDDLKLWRFFLHYLSTFGISINNITITLPSTTTYSDACEWGIGGFTTQGLAWRFLLPQHLQLRASINFLEFLAAIVTIELSLQLDEHPTTYPHLLSFTDNSSALGWLYHSTFNPKTHIHHDKLARYLARLLFKNEATIHPEHIPGKNNIIADSLSRDFQLNDADLTHLLLSSPLSKSQMPPSFGIISLPKTTSSWIASQLESMPPSSMVSRPIQMPSSLAASNDTSTSSTNVTSTTTPSLTTAPQMKNISSSPASPTTSDSTSTDPHPNDNSPVELLIPPSPMWFRPSNRTYGPTQLATH